MATQTTMGRTADQRQNPNKILFWAVGFAVIVILGLAFSMMRTRSLFQPLPDTFSRPMDSTPTEVPNPNPTRDDYRYTDPN